VCRWWVARPPPTPADPQSRVAPGLSVQARALRYLAQRDHSRVELERKLARQVEDLPEDPAAVQIARVLDTLTARGLLSEQRAAEALVGAQARRFGGLKLRQNLRARGVAPDEAAAALATVADTELARAHALWQRRFGATATDAAGRAKQARFLAGRGFGGDVIRRVVQGLGEDIDND
jgi:regulatory protein